MRSNRRIHRGVAFGLCMALVAAACSSGGDESEPSTSLPPGAARDTGPFTVALSAGSPVVAAEPALAVVQGDDLDGDAIAAVVRDLPTFDRDDDRVRFNRPPESRPRPRAGETIDVPLGGATRPAPPTAADGPLEVVRSQPVGDVDIAPDLSVTFNQPMVPVGTLAQLDDAEVPVKVTPALEGRWRWIGTRTVRFEFGGSAGAVDRLPMATEYTVEVPAGTKSQTGGRLDETVRWTFRTPPPRVLTFAPEGMTVDTEPVFVATFDQRVDVDAVVATIELTAGDDARDVRPATAAEIEADDRARQIVEEAEEGRWVAFRPEEALPNGSPLEIAIGPETPSAEGPRTTTKASVHTATTYAELEIARHECGYGEGCRPGSQFTIEFNNALDVDAFDPDLVKIEPAVTATVGMYENTVVVDAATKANTTYTVQFPAELRDTFGQTLGADETVEFEVGRAAPALIGFSRELTTTDPMAERPTVAVTSVGHETLKVEVFAVTPTQWIEYQAYVRARFEGDGRDARRPDWRLVSRSTITVEGGGGELAESTIDLGADLDGASGHLVVVVSPTREFRENDDFYWNNRPTITWVQVTGIGVDALASDDELIAWATDLRDGTPLEGVQVQLGGTEVGSTTDDDGVARLALARAHYLTATQGDDVALLPADATYEWAPTSTGDQIVGFAFDDRGLYRPGETVHVKGWFRRVRLSADARVTPLAGDRNATWIAYDSFGTELGKGSVELSPVSGFDLELDLPVGAALGSASLDVMVGDDEPGSAASVAFQIQEFRRPEFEVVARAESAGPHLLTEPVTVAAQAEYFSGGTLPDAGVTWQVTTRSTTYSPPNWTSFTFGEWRPYWMEDFGGRGFAADFAAEYDGEICCGPQVEENAATYTGRTDSTGTHYLQLDFEGEKPDLPITVSANAAVEDVNRQSFASNLELLVHPSTLYVGLRGSRQFAREGEPLDIEAIVTDIDGDAVDGRKVTITASRMVSKFDNGEWIETEVDPQSCEVTSSTEPVACSIDTGVGGEYKVAATVVDDAGGRNRSELTRWVSGGEAIPSRNVEQEAATVVPDQDRYAPGDTAELLVIAPFSDAHGLLTISANGTTTTQRFALDEGSAVVEVPITDAHVPGVGLQVDLAGQAPRLRDDGKVDADLPPRPAFATASLSLLVEPAAETLTVTAEARERVSEPGEEGTVDVAVTAANGSAVADAEVAVVVVDEAVLSLTGYELPDPLGAFYPPRADEQYFDYLRNSLVLANPATFGREPAPASTTTSPAGQDEDGRSSEDSAGTGGDLAPGDAQYDGESYSANRVRLTADGVEVRTNFDAFALFAPRVRTDASGTASVTFDLPDNLTRYRVMAVVADDGGRFGAGESTLTARLPLQVRPSAPRFANFGDRFEFPVVLQNLTDEPIVADLVIETSNLTVTGSSGRRVEVPANDRVEVRFPAEAESAGTARFRVTTAGADRVDSVSGAFPVYTPVTTEAFATYGVIDDGAIVQPLLTPSGVVPEFGGLEIDTSSTAMQALTDAIVYLEDYPYESADAYASRIIALTSLRDVFAAFGGEGVPTAAEVDDRIEADIAALVALQRDDGGFSTWTRFGDPQPYVSVQATEALVLARLAGFVVGDEPHRRALAYIHDIESYFPSYWDAQARHAVSAYALRVRGRAGDRDPAKAESLYRSDDALPLDALAWLWPVVDDPEIDAEIARTIANVAHDTPGAVTFSSGYDDGAHLVLASDRRTDGIVLDALISERPDSDLIPKAVAGLIGNQVKGRWNNIQENGFILVALQRYFATFEAQTPSFVARVWLGDDYAAEHAYEGRSIDRRHTLVPMTELGGDPDIVLAKDGSGRLYYRLGLRYAPSDLTLDPRDEGFVVDRVYEAVDDEGDVRRDGTGTWHIEPGAMVRVRVTMVADSNRTNMVLVDPLPAGLEAVNPVLAASPRPPAEDPVAGSDPVGLPTWYGWTWFDHENLRDDRVEAYGSYLYGGTYEYTYIARATTPGVFVVPPARAEEIYAPEVFGRSAGDTVAIG